MIPLYAAPATPRISLYDPALKHRPIRPQALPDSIQTKHVEAAEGGQVGHGEGSEDYVDRPRYTFNCEELVNRHSEAIFVHSHTCHDKH